MSKIKPLNYISEGQVYFVIFLLWTIKQSQV